MVYHKDSDAMVIVERQGNTDRLRRDEQHAMMKLLDLPLSVKVIWMFALDKQLGVADIAAYGKSGAVVEVVGRLWRFDLRTRW